MMHGYIFIERKIWLAFPTRKMKESVPILFLVHCIVTVNGQIGVTGCTAATQANCPNFLPNSYCNLGNLFCECPAGYHASDTNIACEYECGGLNDPDNGAVATKDGTRTGDIAVYSCVTTYKLVGTATRTCVQDNGWDGAQPTCEPVEIGEDCSANTFQCDNINNGQCQGFSTCQCKSGYEDDGTGLACSDIDECTPNQCQNGATCVDGINEYTCNCVVGYDGNHCQNDIDECTPNQCQNGATCVDGINEYTCNCVVGYDGNHCQNDINDCVDNLCENGATCVDGINEYTCVCVAGYDGDLCQNNINECESHTCQNCATCVDGINSYTCICLAGYDGEFCNKYTQVMGECNCSTQSVVIGTVLGLVILILLVYAGYMTTTIRRNQAKDAQEIKTINKKSLVDQVYVNESFSTRVSDDLKQGIEQNPGRSSEYIDTNYSTLDDRAKDYRPYDSVRSTFKK